MNDQHDRCGNENRNKTENTDQMKNNEVLYTTMLLFQMNKKLD
jgi:hypothetical protein